MDEERCVELVGFRYSLIRFGRVLSIEELEKIQRFSKGALELKSEFENPLMVIDAMINVPYFGIYPQYPELCYDLYFYGKLTEEEKNPNMGVNEFWKMLLDLRRAHALNASKSLVQLLGPPDEIIGNTWYRFEEEVAKEIYPYVEKAGKEIEVMFGGNRFKIREKGQTENPANLLRV